MSKNVILKNRNGEQVFPATTLEQVHYEGNLNLKQAIRQMTVHAVNASTAAEMMDAGKIYVYTGSEDGYTFGDWYYWNKTAWVSGGSYNAAAIGAGTVNTIELTDEAVTYQKLSDEIANVEYEILDGNKILNTITEQYIAMLEDHAAREYFIDTTIESKGGNRIKLKLSWYEKDGSQFVANQNLPIEVSIYNGISLMETKRLSLNFTMDDMEAEIPVSGNYSRYKVVVKKTDVLAGMIAMLTVEIRELGVLSVPTVARFPLLEISKENLNDNLKHEHAQIPEAYSSIFEESINPVSGYQKFDTKLMISGGGTKQVSMMPATGYATYLNAVKEGEQFYLSGSMNLDEASGIYFIVFTELNANTVINGDYLTMDFPGVISGQWKQITDCKIEVPVGARYMYVCSGNGLLPIIKKIVRVNRIEENVQNISKLFRDKIDLQQGEENADKVLVVGEGGSITNMAIEQKHMSAALMEKIENAGSKWIDLEDGEEFYYKAPLAIIEITAVITDSSTVFFDSMTIDSIKKYLTVTAYFNDDTQVIVTDYTLSGSIVVGTCSMTVTYMGHKTTVDIVVQERVAMPESITAVCSETIVNIYTELEDLRQYLTVTLHYDDGAQEAVTEYVLSGTLQTGTSKITVTYQDFTTTFTVTGVDSGGYTTNNITAMYDFSKYDDLHIGDVLDEINSYPADCGALETVTNNSDKGGIRGGFFVPARRYLSGVMQSAYLAIPSECQVGIYPFSVEIYGRIRGSYNDYNSSPGIVDPPSNNTIIFTSRQDQNKNSLVGYILNAFVTQDRQYLRFDGNASQPNLITKDIDIPYANAAQNIKTLSHIVCCADATAQKVYFNGALIKEDTQKGVNLGGCEKATLKFDNYFDIGVVRVYSRMLTDKEVLRNYNDCVTRIGREMP